MRRVLLRALVFATVGACTARSGMPSPAPQTPTAQRPPTATEVEPAFAEIVATELGRVTQPVMTRRGGREEPVTDFVIVYVRLTQMDRWLPRGLPTEQILLGESVVTALTPPTDRSVTPLLAARPSGADLSDATLWVLPGGRSARDIPLAELTVLDRDARRSGPAASVALPAASRLPGEIRQFPSLVELTAHARNTAATLKPAPRK